MKPLIVNTMDIDGGAARAAYRLHQGLKQINIDSRMLVGNKTSDDITVLGTNNKLDKAWIKIAGALDSLPLKTYSPSHNLMFSLQWLPDQIGAKVVEINPDVIHLHWINTGYMQIETLGKFKKPIVWTLHDMWAFTGGCHYSEDCDKYTMSCGACPQLGSHRKGDITQWIWQRKAKAWSNLNLTIVTPSLWLADCAKKSLLFQNLRIEVIPNGLNTQVYKPMDKIMARKWLNLPLDKHLILFGAINPTANKRKGFHLLKPAIQKLSQQHNSNNIELVIFGASQPSQVPNFGFKTHYLGRLHDDIGLALVYSAADVMIVPSLQEAFGQTASESLACGTPVVAFDITGLKDIIDHQHNGYLAKPFDVDDLAQGITWVLEDKERLINLSKNAREKVERNFSLEIQANSYLSIYKYVCEN
ncbi:glycosyltransferase family 4 protein [Anabaenopsis sp. FSS-46]|uniref:glycosyltransferase family 4 protein n=1 Tax=Anabaenopsis sp. FSS-46 TaxID=2971766 RepID=UPI0024768E46|nr:glycosyltransferase family 4 protein [Anabaenopsis sp. FSS-46]MDH6100029.1 glycosyltransferase family 4 protein [Anabaenopsis sp. FSS-46]